MEIFVQFFLELQITFIDESVKHQLFQSLQIKVIGRKKLFERVDIFVSSLKIIQGFYLSNILSDKLKNTSSPL